MSASAISFNDSISEELVDIKDKNRSNLFTWRGQFSPQLVEQLIINYASKDDIIFDPFLGSGTVLIESALLGHEAIGCEINPAAVYLSKVYELINYEDSKIKSSIEEIDEFVLSYIDNTPLFSGGIKNIDDFESELIAISKLKNNPIDRIIFFAFIVGMDFENKKNDIKRIKNVWFKLKDNINSLPKTDKKIKCYNRDSRKTILEDNSIDFVITSPPYINVFNYHQNYRKSVEKLGIDVLSVAKSEIGANRKFRQNRFLTVVQYCMDMSQVFCELRRVCKKDSKIIFVVGRESNVRKTSFKNAEIISDVASICGFNLEGNQYRFFNNKFGNDICEIILKFTINELIQDNTLDAAREIGIKALEKSLSYCGNEVIYDIREAIIKSEEINTSPLFDNKGK